MLICRFQELVNGTNIYGIVRALRGASTECIVINIPMHEERMNYASGVALVFGQLARSECYDIFQAVFFFVKWMCETALETIVMHFYKFVNCAV